MAGLMGYELTLDLLGMFEPSVAQKRNLARHAEHRA
jgi:hypothetical protein